MKREEEIEKNAEERTLEIFGELDDFQDVTDGFIEGANWADKTMIDKICDWLQNIDFEVEYFTTDSDGYTFFNADKFIENFRKAMEE